MTRRKSTRKDSSTKPGLKRQSSRRKTTRRSASKSGGSLLARFRAIGQERKEKHAEKVEEAKFDTFKKALHEHVKMIRSPPMNLVVSGKERFFVVRNFILYFHLKKQCNTFVCNKTPIEYKTVLSIQKSAEDTVNNISTYLKGRGLLQNEAEKLKTEIKNVIEMVNCMADEYAKFFVQLTNMNTNSTNRDELNSELECFISSDNFKKLFSINKHTLENDRTYKATEQFATSIEETKLYLGLNELSKHLLSSNNKTVITLWDDLQKSIENIKCGDSNLNNNYNNSNSKLNPATNSNTDPTMTTASNMTTAPNNMTVNNNQMFAQSPKKSSSG